MADRFCKRTGCTKKLRANNGTGMCGSGCESKEAPPAKQGGSSSTGVMKRFRTVAHALGKDPNVILEEAAKTWLDVVSKAVE